MKPIFFLFFFFIFSSYFSLSFSLSENDFLIAQDQSFFDDSDLAEIEGDDINEKDQELEDEFESFTGEEVKDNFDEGDFEVIDETGNFAEGKGADSKKEENEDLQKKDDFDEDDYEVISDKPGYEVISDEELEREFEEAVVPDESAQQKPSDEGEEEIDDIPDELTSDKEEKIEMEFVPDEEGDTAIEVEAAPDEEEKIEMEFVPDEEGDTAIEVEAVPDEEGDIAIEVEAAPDEEEKIEMESVPDEEGDTAIEVEAAPDEEEKIEMEFVPDEEGDTAIEVEAVPDEEEDTAIEKTKELEDEISMQEEPFSEEALNVITNIRYLTSKDQIVIDCSEPTSYEVDKNEETNQFIIEILQAKLADNLHWPYVMKDFDTQFGLIKADQKDSSTVRIIIQLKEGADFPQSTLTEIGNQILIAYGQVIGHQIVPLEDISDNIYDPSSILPAKTLEDLYSGNIQFSGSPISFHVIDAPIKQVLRFISEESGLNMVIGENVTGTLTLKLEDVPWDQALYTIFKVKSLGYTRDGNVITILPLGEIEERTKKLKEISDRQQGLLPYETKVIPVNYGKIDEIEAKVKVFSTPASNFSQGGKLIVHPESNTFVVIDTPKAIKKIESLVKYLDKPPKQVMVEAKIVEVAENFARNFGLTWGLGGNVPVTINASGLIELLGNISGSYRGQFNEQGMASLNLSGLPIIGDINASLSLAEQDGHAQVISTPKVVVISGKSASITRNTPILIPVSTNTTQNTDGTTSTQQSVQKETVSISLNVTPTVTTRGSVFLKVNVTRSDPGGRGGSFKTERTAETEVLVKNGQTIVIGGIYEQDEVKQSDGLPFLKDIPFLNRLFNTTGTNRSKAELLVFITPKLLDSHE